jgi:hypothetical protein
VADNVYHFLMIRINKQNLKHLHGIDEQITIDDYLAAIRLYHHLLIQVATANTDQHNESHLTEYPRVNRNNPLVN